ncbi:hypothetical protein H109_02172 [Trichophyton interdigitale MR816]|uniref:Uncharacterized protein n=1 Tax=Trichophyton interdigitale (strain MR816) TaxID=1215338 RepID=A0A059JDJ7_TRIIM|nr:hypothetical protein H109_02172 [Trichophyton interdigitale MR816]
MGEVCDAWVVGHSRMGIPKSHVDAKITTLLNYFKRDAALDRIQLLIVMYVITGGRVHRPPHKIVSQHKLVCFIFFFFYFLFSADNIRFPETENESERRPYHIGCNTARESIPFMLCK